MGDPTLDIEWSEDDALISAKAKARQAAIDADPRAKRAQTLMHKISEQEFRLACMFPGLPRLGQLRARMGRLIRYINKRIVGPA